MSRFNTKTPTTKTTNLAGGEAFKESPELELISLLLTSFAADKFYEKATDQFDRLKSLVERCDKKFVAQATIYARTKFGMRSITHVTAAELAKHITGQPWAKNFYRDVVHRPDDMTETLSYHLAGKNKVTNAMRKGFGEAFAKFDKYALAKYRSENKSLKLVDVVNLIHPQPVDKNREALEALVKGDLKSFDTWESSLTQAGQQASNEDEKAELKKEAWVNLIREKKIGYFALLRNLRNIIEQAPEMVTEACDLLVNETMIKKSLVLPFRFTTAFDEINKITTPIARQILIALNKAVDIAVSNVPKFDGDTLVVLDGSGSMTGKPAQIGSLFAAVLIKSNNADFIVFSDRAQYRNVNSLDSTITIANSIKFASGGTDFHSIFQTANRKYDRIIILSDMQGWIGHNTPTQTFNQYKSTTGADPFVYSFDLNGYGTLQFPERNVFAIAGFSEKIFDLMKMMEVDRNAMINEIRKIEL